jgi:GT2 family glycosyltransferase
VARIWHIIVPVFNPPAQLLDNLERLEASCPGATARVVLVDDGSDNGVPKLAEERFPGLTRMQGDGGLWWCGGMKLGMAHALEQGAEVVVWLNHDCVPCPGALEELVELAAAEGNGAVSAWCCSMDAPDFPVNPGFRNLKEIPVEELKNSRIVTVDGVNGNCVAINAAAIRAVGLPDAAKHPHYGDGPYTFRLHQAGFRNLVLTSARALLEREYDRCIRISWRCAFWPAPLSQKIRYYFLSRKSKFHWSIKYHDAVAFRGYPLAPFSYLASMALALSEICKGHRMQARVPRQERLRRVCETYQDQFPQDGLIESLKNLENGK